MAIKAQYPHENYRKTIVDFLQNEEVQLDKPHILYHIDVDNLLKNRNIGGGEPIAWRFFGKNKAGKKGVHEVSIGKSINDTQYSGFHSGNHLNTHRKFLETPEKHTLLENMEHAFLRINSLKIYTLWFKNEDQSRDLFYPLTPRFYGLKPKFYTWEAFNRILVEAAESHKSLDSTKKHALSAG